MAKEEKKRVRAQFNQSVLKRDGHKCFFCSRTDDLDVHHIVNRTRMPNGGYVKENGITLCPDHHLKAEYFVEGYEPKTLYDLIGSSADAAFKAASNAR